MVGDEQTVRLGVEQAQVLAIWIRVLEMEAGPGGRVAPVQREQEPGAGIGIEIDEGRVAAAPAGVLGDDGLATPELLQLDDGLPPFRPVLGHLFRRWGRDLVSHRRRRQAEDREQDPSGEARPGSRRPPNLGSGRLGPRRAGLGCLDIGSTERAGGRPHGTAARKTAAIRAIRTRLTRSRSANTNGSSCMRARCAMSHM